MSEANVEPTHGLACGDQYSLRTSKGILTGTIIQGINIRRDNNKYSCLLGLAGADIDSPLAETLNNESNLAM